MEYTHVGRLGLVVSRLCLGTMNFGPHTPEDESHRIMDAAIAEGINFFDTANVYGRHLGVGSTEPRGLLIDAAAGAERRVLHHRRRGCHRDRRQCFRCCYKRGVIGLTIAGSESIWANRPKRPQAVPFGQGQGEYLPFTWPKGCSTRPSNRLGTFGAVSA